MWLTDIEFVTSARGSLKDAHPNSDPNYQFVSFGQLLTVTVPETGYSFVHQMLSTASSNKNTDCVKYWKTFQPQLDRGDHLVFGWRELSPHIETYRRTAANCALESTITTLALSTDPSYQKLYTIAGQCLYELTGGDFLGFQFQKQESAQQKSLQLQFRKYSCNHAEKMMCMTRAHRDCVYQVAAIIHTVFHAYQRKIPYLYVIDNPQEFLTYRSDSGEIFARFLVACQEFLYATGRGQIQFHVITPRMDFVAQFLKVYMPYAHQHIDRYENIVKLYNTIHPESWDDESTAKLHCYHNPIILLTRECITSREFPKQNSSLIYTGPFITDDVDEKARFDSMDTLCPGIATEYTKFCDEFRSRCLNTPVDSDVSDCLSSYLQTHEYADVDVAIDIAQNYS